jgi:thiazole synthase
MSDRLKIGNDYIENRLITGSGKYSVDSIIPEIIDASGCEVVTVALRRVDIDSKENNILQHIPENVKLLPNTSGARSAQDAVRIAEISMAAGCGNWIKIEIIKDNKYLLPDGYETIKATEILAEKGFTVLPYINPDLMVAKSLVNSGAAAVMPLGAPIGTNKGLTTEELLKILIEEISVPIIVDAGIGKPSDACRAMELGADACLLNTAIASSRNPVLMAAAFSKAVKAGREAYLAGLGKVSKYAEASSPLTGFLNLAS